MRVREARGLGTTTISFAYGDECRLLLTSISRDGETISYGRTASGQLDFVTSLAGTIDYVSPGA